MSVQLGIPRFYFAQLSSIDRKYKLYSCPQVNEVSQVVFLLQYLKAVYFDRQLFRSINGHSRCIRLPTAEAATNLFFLPLVGGTKCESLFKSAENKIQYANISQVTLTGVSLSAYIQFQIKNLKRLADAQAKNDCHKLLYKTNYPLVYISHCFAYSMCTLITFLIIFQIIKDW